MFPYVSKCLPTTGVNYCKYQAIAPVKARYSTCCCNMGVGKIFSRGGHLWMLFAGVVKIFFQKEPNVVKFQFTHSKLQNQPLLLNM